MILLQFQTVLLPYKLCVTEKSTEPIKELLLLTAFFVATLIPITHCNVCVHIAFST